MTKIKKGTALGYFMPGIIILCVLSFITLCLLCVPTYIYLSTLTVAGLVHYFMIKRHEHPWGLNQDQIEDSKKISVCIVGAGFSGTNLIK
jgi:FlaA1/EpsC-like NDP-sugar epimerase